MPVRRVERMERIFDNLRHPDIRWSDPAAQEQLQTLLRYYTGGAWMSDYERDERGEFPPDLKRGVLSEDGVYNLLTDISRIEKRYTEMKKIPVIIDCDPGVDDSYAIALIRSRSEFEIVALTAVEGNVPASLTRRNCLGLRETLNMPKTKVAFGAERPLVKSYDRKDSITHGAGGVGGYAFSEPALPPETQPAWDVIYEEAVRHSGELVLFAVGPLTNIAIALREHPDLPKYIKRFIIMGGGTFGNVTATGEKAEFNIWIDPTAALEVFEKMKVWMVGLNATHASAVPEDDFDEMLAITENGTDPACRLIHQLSAFSRDNCYRNGQDNNVIHDALAVASLLEPDVVTFEKRRVHVVDTGEPNEGETVISPSGMPDANCYVAMQVDREKFVSMLKDMCRYYAKL